MSDSPLMDNAGTSLTIPSAAEVDTASRRNDHSQSLRSTYDGRFAPTVQIDTELERHKEMLDLALAEERELKARAGDSAVSTPGPLRNRINMLSKEIAFGLGQRQKIVASHEAATGDVQSRQLRDLRKADMTTAIIQIQRENASIQRLTAMEAEALLEKEFATDGDAAVARRLPQYYRVWNRLNGGS